MSINSLFQPMTQTPQPAVKSVGFSEAFEKSRQAAKYNDLLESRGEAFTKAKQDRRQLLKDSFGVDLDEVKIEGIEKPSQFDTRFNFGKRDNKYSSVDSINAEIDYEERVIAHLKEQDPDKYGSIPGYDQLVKAGMGISKETQEELNKLDPGIDGFLSPGGLGRMAGTAAAFATSPVNILSMAIAPTGGASLVSKVATNALVGLAEEAVIFPAVKKYQNEMGRKYGFEEFTNNAIGAAIGANLFTVAGAGIKGAAKSARFTSRTLAKMPGLPQDLRQKLEVMGRKADIIESAPDPKKLGEHVENYTKIQKAIDNGDPMPDDLNLDTRDYIVNDYPVKDTADELIAQEFKEMKGDYAFKEVIEDTPLKDLDLKDINGRISRGEVFEVWGVDRNGDYFAADIPARNIDEVDSFLRSRKIEPSEANVRQKNQLLTVDKEGKIVPDIEATAEVEMKPLRKKHMKRGISRNKADMMARKELKDAGFNPHQKLDQIRHAETFEPEPSPVIRNDIESEPIRSEQAQARLEEDLQMDKLRSEADKLEAELKEMEDFPLEDMESVKQAVIQDISIKNSFIKAMETCTL